MYSTRFLYGKSAPIFRMCPNPRNRSKLLVRWRIFLSPSSARARVERSTDARATITKTITRVVRTLARGDARVIVSLARLIRRVPVDRRSRGVASARGMIRGSARAVRRRKRARTFADRRREAVSAARAASRVRDEGAS